MITRCPKCATAFRISEDHLKSAKGMVRCGNCLDVFNARENLHDPAKKTSPSSPTDSQDKSSLSKTEVAETPTAETQAPKTSPARSPSSGNAEQAEASDVDTAEQSASPKAPKDQAATKSAAGMFDSSEHNEDVDDDEAWALELLKDDSDLDIQLKKIVTPEDKAKLASKEPRYTPHKPIVEQVSGTAPVSSIAATRESAAQSAAEKAPRITIKPAPGEPKTPPAEAQKKETKDKPGGKSGAHPIQDLLASIGAEPLEVAYEDPRTRVRRRLLWGAACLGAIILLIAQVAWLEFSRLSKLEPYRSYYAKICPSIGCTLPEITDTSAISASKLMVRTHPSEKNALMVDVILQNNADFEQSFPALLLTFSDLQNKTVAARQFKPDEYLGGELTGVDRMPVKQPIHVAIEIQDPGAKALSYSMTIAE